MKQYERKIIIIIIILSRKEKEKRERDRRGDIPEQVELAKKLQN